MLDTNCLIDLDELREPRAAQLGLIVDAARNGDLELVVAAIRASENAPQGSEKAFALFIDRLERVGLADLRVLHPMAYFGVTFWDHALLVDAEMTDLEVKIHDILVPDLPIEGDSGDHKWINAKCDVQLVWCHLWHGTSALVTSDGGILRRADALAELGAVVKPPATIVAEL